MSMRRVDVVDPGPEGASIVDALREHQIEVATRSVESLRDGSDAAVVILAGDAEGALEALRVFSRLEDTATAPVLLVGSPQHDPFDTDVAVELGADAFYARPVPIERLVRKVEALLELTLPPPADKPEPGTAAGPDASDSGESRAAVIDAPHSAGDDDDDAGEPSQSRAASHAVSQVLVVARREVSEVVPLPPPSEPPPQLRTEASVPGFRPPERTMQLTEGGSPRPITGAPPDTPGDAAGSQPTSVGVSPPLPARPSAPIADLAPELARMLLAADRRVFPNAAPIDLAFPASHEPPDVLVPGELLEPGAHLDPIEDDPLEAFTWVGQRGEATMPPSLTPGPPPSQPPPAPGSQLPPPKTATPAVIPPAPPAAMRTELPLTSGGPPTPPAPPAIPAAARVDITAARKRSVHPPPASARGAAQPSRQGDLGEPTDHGVGRRGMLADGGVLPLLWRTVEQRLDATITLTLEPPLEIMLVLVSGELRALDGPIALRVLDGLRRERRAVEAPRDEMDAAAVLERRVQAGLLGRFELDRRVARARESVLHDAVAARSGSFVIEPLDATAIDVARTTAPVLATSLIEALVEGSRRRIDAHRARTLLSREPAAIGLANDAQTRLADLRIAPELAALVVRHDGAPLETLLAAATAGEGLAGLVFALASLDVIEMRPLSAKPPSPAELVRGARETISAIASLADDGDYFAILGLDPSASAREVEAAWAERRRDLERLELDALGLGELLPLRDAVLDVLDEARDVLSDDALRSRYRTALGLGGAAGAAS